jgi:signal transduction histidine kinase
VRLETGGRVVSAGGYKIDTDRLETMQRRLDECDDRMRAAINRLKKVGPQGLGTESLDEACAEFQEQWDNGIGQIAKASEKASRGLKAAIDSYRANEDGTSQAFNGSKGK